jgi:hypothetical protein
MERARALQQISLEGKYLEHKHGQRPSTRRGSIHTRAHGFTQYARSFDEAPVLHARKEKVIDHCLASASV